MKNALILLVLGTVFITGCSNDSTKEREDQTTKEVLLDLKIKEATKVFEKYGWTPDSTVDRNSKAFREEYEQMDLEQLDKMLKMFHEGIEYENMDSIKEDKKATRFGSGFFLFFKHSFQRIFFLAVYHQAKKDNRDQANKVVFSEVIKINIRQENRQSHI